MIVTYSQDVGFMFLGCDVILLKVVLFVSLF